MGNLHSYATEEDLCKLFGLRLTQYLKQNCLFNMFLINKTGKSNGFAFIFTPGKVHHDLLKLDRIEWLGRPNFVVNNFRENQYSFKRPRIIPDISLHVTAVSEYEVDATYEERNYSRQPQRKKVFIIRDSHLTRIKKDSLRKKFEGHKLYFKCFSGANTKQLDHYVIPVLVNEKPQTIFIHIGSNDITKFNYHDAEVNDLANIILQIGMKCRFYGVESIAISSINGAKELFYEKNYTRIGVNTNDDVLLNKPLKFPTLTIIITCVFQEGEKLYPQIYLDECLYKL